MAKVDKPRPRMTPLAFFVQACRAEIRRRYPEARVSVAVLSRACSERWRTTSAQQRALFKHLAREDKQRFDREWGVSAQQPPKSRSRRDPHAPKKPLTAFFLFASVNRPLIRAHWPGLSVPEQAKKLGQKWAEQTAEERRPFEIKAAELKEKYEAEVAVYHGGVTGKGGATGKVEYVKQQLEPHLARGPAGEENEENHEIFAQYSAGLLEEDEHTHGLEAHLNVAQLQSQGGNLCHTNLSTHHNVKSEEKEGMQAIDDHNNETFQKGNIKEQAKAVVGVCELSLEPAEVEGFEEETDEEEDVLEACSKKGNKEAADAAELDKPVHEEYNHKDEYEEESLVGKGR